MHFAQGSELCGTAEDCNTVAEHLSARRLSPGFIRGITRESNCHTCVIGWGSSWY